MGKATGLGRELERAAAAGTADAELLKAAADYVFGSDELLGLADEMLRRGLDFTLPFVNDARGDRLRSMQAMRAYAEARGIEVHASDGRDVW